MRARSSPISSPSARARRCARWTIPGTPSRSAQAGARGRAAPPHSSTSPTARRCAGSRGRGTAPASRVAASVAASFAAPRTRRPTRRRRRGSPRGARSARARWRPTSRPNRVAPGSRRRCRPRARGSRDRRRAHAELLAHARLVDRLRARRSNCTIGASHALGEVLVGRADQTRSTRRGAAARPRRPARRLPPDRPSARRRPRAPERLLEQRELREQLGWMPALVL